MNHMFIVSTPDLGSLEITEAHLVLPHLYKNPEYLAKYKERSAAGDYLLQDNSIFELKTCVGGDLVEFGKQIGASCIMVPETLRDADECIAKKDQFFEDIKKIDGSDKFTYAAAVQGKSYAEIARHYENLANDPRVTVIAIPFNFEFDAFGEEDEDAKHAGWNRFSIVWRLYHHGLWNANKQHHLLGLYNPAELGMYHPNQGKLPRSVYDSIKTNDSSSCYWHSLYGVRYSESVGLLYRKIETHVNFDVEYMYPEQYDTFGYNRKILRSFASGNVVPEYSIFVQRYADLSYKTEEGYNLWTKPL